jgi:hypothetical protein
MRHRPRPFHGTQCSLVRTDLLSEKQRNRPGARLAESSVATGHPAETTAHRQIGGDRGIENVGSLLYSTAHHPIHPSVDVHHPIMSLSTY